MLRTSSSSLPQRLLLLCLVCLLPGCASWYKVEVGGEAPESTHSVFLIVADTDPIDAFKIEDMSKLITAERISKYLLFAQFDPDSARPLRWRKQSVRGDSDLVKVDLSSDGSVLTLRANKELLTTYPNLAIVVVGHGTEGWYAEAIDPGRIRSEEGTRLDIGSSRFLRRLLR